MAKKSKKRRSGGGGAIVVRTVSAPAVRRASRRASRAVRAGSENAVLTAAMLGSAVVGYAEQRGALSFVPDLIPGPMSSRSATLGLAAYALGRVSSGSLRRYALGASIGLLSAAAFDLGKSAAT